MSGLDTLPEDIVAVFPCCILEVRVSIRSDEVTGFDDGLVLGVDPCCPGIDVSDLDLAGSD